MRIAARSDIGLVRKKNEDNFMIEAVGDSLVMIIADGLGGCRSGEIASKIAVETSMRVIREGLLLCDNESKIKDLMSSAFKQSNVEILLKSVLDNSYSGMASTLTIAILRSNHLIVSHIGDCRVYLFHGSSSEQLTKDHTYAAELVRSGMITSEMALTHPGKNMLMKALGENEYITPDFYHYNIIYGDLILLCTDGLYNYIGEKELNDQLRMRYDAKVCIDNLMETVYANGAGDNVTIIVVQNKPGIEKELVSL